MSRASADPRRRVLATGQSTPGRPADRPGQRPAPLAIGSTRPDSPDRPALQPRTTDPDRATRTTPIPARSTDMAGETTLTVVGNLTTDPELRYTPNGLAVANFTVASTPRTYDRQAGGWKDADPLFLRCTLWRQPAENAAESLTKGTRVIVTGRLRQRSYEAPQGEKRTVTELDADEIGASLRYATTKITKTSRGEGSSGLTSQPENTEPPF